MIRVKMHEAKTNLSRLAARAAAGEEVILMRGDVPVARIVPLAPEEKPRRQPGRFKGVFDLDDRFFEPLPEEELEAWNNPK
ncbi:MAG TPA: prevent-host-death protein [Kaistia sp.]|nr:prevent-host-death protein [Kaistia sp.]